ncbi:MAG: metalloregulator ArsR/SmtB family transcription factor [Desulfitobacteriaceae bacterium]
MINAVKISKALADPIRYKILLMLVNHRGTDSQFYCSPTMGGVCNCEIMEEFGMIQSRVSYHMKELIDSELVTEEPKGKWKYYFLNPETFKEYIKQLGANFKL